MANTYSKEQWIAAAAILAVGVPLIMWAKSSGGNKESNKRSDPEKAAVRACSDMIKGNAKFPSSVDLHLMTGLSTDMRGPRNTARVFLDFDAKNGFGAEVSFTAECHFDTDPPTLNVTNR